MGNTISHGARADYALANTAEPLYLVNRRGSRPSYEGAAARFDQAIVAMSKLEGKG